MVIPKYLLQVGKNKKDKVVLHQNLGHKIGGAVFMSKLTRKDKIEIYERKKSETISSLAKFFKYIPINKG